MKKESLLIISYFIIWPIIMTVPAYIFYKMPKHKFNPNSFLFKKTFFEKDGLIYEKVFFVKKWKHLLPDGAALVKNGFRKKKLKNASKEYINDFIIETCKAEATHIAPIFLSFLFAIYNPPYIVLIMFIFAVITNIPCIIVQRYNRIRLVNMIEKYY